MLRPLAVTCLPITLWSMGLTQSRDPSDDDVLAMVKEITRINRIIREGLAVWHRADSQVFRDRLAAVEAEDSPAPRLRA